MGPDNRDRSGIVLTNSRHPDPERSRTANDASKDTCKIGAHRKSLAGLDASTAGVLTINHSGDGRR
ncbi:hypothetical protein HDF12_002688 [Edaphobacter lichenicola]|uniref:Uncharacterized protein n=2 Tax=Tunturiibacter TaxID=3154218 RepID=A0A7Y9T5G0_9BACT|nr:hypothetical protein [Edaphobacter lichenicola]NYF52289.1 hypothetical protein [Edaphobacter lichenicola]